MIAAYNFLGLLALLSMIPIVLIGLVDQNKPAIHSNMNACVILGMAYFAIYSLLTILFELPKGEVPHLVMLIFGSATARVIFPVTKKA